MRIFLVKPYALIVYAFVLLLYISACREKAEKATAGQAEDLATLEEAGIEAYNQAFWDWIPRDAVVEVLASGHDWTEGPLWLEADSSLLYTDIPRNSVYKWKEGQPVAIYLHPSGFMGNNFSGSEPGANGLLLDPEGRLVLCQHGERRVARMEAPLDQPDTVFTALAGEYNGMRFNSPNDGVYHSNGSLYFTDPPYGLPGRMEDPGKEIPFQGVYRLSPSGEVELLTDEFTRPNGIALSPDESKIYIANSDPEQAIWKVFDLDEEGKLANGRLWYDATHLIPNEKGLPDGLKVHGKGAVFATGPGGVLVFSAEGELLGRIHTGQATANCALDAEQTALYITADSYLLRVRLVP